MKPVIKIMAVLPIMGALILSGGCQSTKSNDPVCPSCDKKVMSYHPQKGRTFKKVACPSCKDVVKVNDQNEITGTLHMCDSCDALVGECPKCSSK